MGKVIDFLDKIFRYMPPIEHKTPLTHPTEMPDATNATVDLEPEPSVQEQGAANLPLIPTTIPGPVGDGGLTPTQMNALITQAKPADDAMLEALKRQALNAAKGAVATGATAIAGGATVGEATEAALPVAGPLAVGIADAGMLGFAGWMMVTGGDINLNALLGENSANLTPAQYNQFNAMLASGNTEGATEFLMKAENRLGTKQIVDAEGNYVSVGRNAAIARGGAAVADDTEADPSMYVSRVLVG